MHDIRQTLGREGVARGGTAHSRIAGPDRHRTLPAPAEGGRHRLPDAQVMTFLYGLRRIPFAAWSRCDETPTDLALQTRLHTALDSVPQLEARIRRRVDHVLAACDGIAPSDVVARMRAAACLAAGALAVRSALTRDEFARLYGAFATLAPLDRPAPLRPAGESGGLTFSFPQPTS